MENTNESQLFSAFDAESKRNKFPPEILAHIFKLGAQSLYPNTHKPAQAHLPWRISKVSQFWRSVALSTPCLWTNIVIERTHLQPAVFEDNISALQLQLDLSQKCPLNLVVELTGPVTMSSESQDKLRDALLPHLDRVRLLVNLGGSWSRIFPASTLSLPPSSMFSSLREIDCTRVSEELLASIPFEQLTYISLAMLEYQDVWDIVERSKGTAETLRIRDPLHCQWLPASPPRGEPGLVLPKLKVLTLYYVGELLRPRQVSNDNKKGWIQSAPMLEELTVLNPEGDDALDLVTAFIRRSSCTLTSFATFYNDLSYMEGRASESSQESLLRTIPTLTSLDMHLYDLNSLNSILKLLARIQTSDTSAGLALPAPMFCPFLKSIRLGSDEEDDVFDLDEFDLASLVDMIELRRAGGLEKVEIRNVIEMGEEDFDEDREAAKVLMETYKIVFI